LRRNRRFHCAGGIFRRRSESRCHRDCANTFDSDNYTNANYWKIGKFNMVRVLVVDDEIDTLNLLSTILEISGYQAFTTLNSVDAITLAEMEHPDCILLDIMMPQLDGFTLCKMMRLHPATMHVPIVFVTAYSALDLEDRRREAGADMVLPKPVGMDVLIEAVQQVTAMRPRDKKRSTGDFL